MTQGGILIWIGIDDTDSKAFGCTTNLMNDLISEFNEYFAIGYPCLVRLNPNIPWKTRGNGAVCIQLSKKVSVESVKFGETRAGKPLLMYPDAQNIQKASVIGSANVDGFDGRDIIERVEAIINSKAALNDDNTNPGIVISNDTLPIDLYWSAVHHVVELDNIKSRLSTLGAKFKGLKKGRGIIGASAAIAWGSNSVKGKTNNIHRSSKSTPDCLDLDSTYELITYRRPENIGTPRYVNPKTVSKLDQLFPSTFNNYDHTCKHVAITPNSPCPVLFGIRGDNIDDLERALIFLTPESEPIDKWLFFNTNQGTDDHLISTEFATVKQYSSVILTGQITDVPWTILGGHVLFTLEELNGNTASKQKNDLINEEFSQNTQPTITCAAYEPTKTFRDVIRRLLPGDIISIYGGIRTEPKTINIEKLKIHNLTKNIQKLHNPRCPSCGHAMKSLGRDQGFRCRRIECHQRLPRSKAEYTELSRDLNLGFYEVPVSARRHLSKPLQRHKISSGHEKNAPKSI